MKSENMDKYITTQAARNIASRLIEESNEVVFVSTRNLLRDSADALRALATMVDEQATEDSMYDNIIFELKSAHTSEEFITVGYKYNLVCVATTTADMNVYMVPYDGGTTVVTRYESGVIKTFRVGAEVAQMLLDIGVNAHEKVTDNMQGQGSEV